MSEARDRAAEAWRQFLQSAVSADATPHEVFAWAYMAGWAHDKWPEVKDIVPPPDVTKRSGSWAQNVTDGQPAVATGPVIEVRDIC